MNNRCDTKAQLPPFSKIFLRFLFSGVSHKDHDTPLNNLTKGVLVRSWLLTPAAVYGVAMSRYAMSVPLSGYSLIQHRDLYREMVDLGYTDLWSSEVDGSDGLTPLALAAAWAQELRLGVAIIPAYTRGPALLAQIAAAMASAAPGRFVMGIGSSSNVIVERWNDIAFERPYYRTRDVVRFMKAAFTGEKITETYDTFDIKGFRLGLPLEHKPPILIAALREQMLAMAGREADGAIINWLSATDVATVASIVHKAADGQPREIVARIFVCPTDDAEVARKVARYAIAAYMNVPVYADFHRWIGRGDQLGPMWEAWAAGDRKGALAAIPDEVADDLVLWGTPDAIREKVQAYVDNGVDTPALALLNYPGVDVMEAVRSLAPK